MQQGIGLLIEALELAAVEQQQCLALATQINQCEGPLCLPQQLLQQHIELGEARQVFRAPQGYLGLGQRPI
ncbi:hypothetical protein D3C84_684050 [compost metagenome]